LAPPGEGAAGGIVWSVKAAGRAAGAAAPVTWTVSGDVVIVLLVIQAEQPERLYAYVTVAY
jgi:hypothetical protein